MLDFVELILKGKLQLSWDWHLKSILQVFQWIWALQRANSELQPLFDNLHYRLSAKSCKLSNKSQKKEKKISLWHACLTYHEKFLKKCLQYRLSPRLKCMVVIPSGPSSHFYLSAVIASVLVEELQRKTCISKINNILEQLLVIFKTEFGVGTFYDWWYFWGMLEDVKEKKALKNGQN